MEFHEKMVPIPFPKLSEVATPKYYQYRDLLKNYIRKTIKDDFRSYEDFTNAYEEYLRSGGRMHGDKAEIFKERPGEGLRRFFFSTDPETFIDNQQDVAPIVPTFSSFWRTDGGPGRKERDVFLKTRIYRDMGGNLGFRTKMDRFMTEVVNMSTNGPDKNTLTMINKYRAVILNNHAENTMLQNITPLKEMAPSVRLHFGAAFNISTLLANTEDGMTHYMDMSLLFEASAFITYAHRCLTFLVANSQDLFKLTLRDHGPTDDAFNLIADLVTLCSNNPINWAAKLNARCGSSFSKPVYIVHEVVAAQINTNLLSGKVVPVPSLPDEISADDFCTPGVSPLVREMRFGMYEAVRFNPDYTVCSHITQNYSSGDSSHTVSYSQMANSGIWDANGFNSVRSLTDRDITNFEIGNNQTLALVIQGRGTSDVPIGFAYLASLYYHASNRSCPWHNGEGPTLKDYFDTVGSGGYVWEYFDTLNNSTAATLLHRSGVSRKDLIQHQLIGAELTEFIKADNARVRFNALMSSIRDTVRALLLQMNAQYTFDVDGSLTLTAVAAPGDATELLIRDSVRDMVQGFNADDGKAPDRDDAIRNLWRHQAGVGWNMKAAAAVLFMTVLGPGRWPAVCRDLDAEVKAEADHAAAVAAHNAAAPPAGPAPVAPDNILDNEAIIIDRAAMRRRLEALNDAMDTYGDVVFAGDTWFSVLVEERGAGVPRQTLQSINKALDQDTPLNSDEFCLTSYLLNLFTLKSANSQSKMRVEDSLLADILFIHESQALLFYSPGQISQIMDAEGARRIASPRKDRRVYAQARMRDCGHLNEHIFGHSATPNGVLFMRPSVTAVAYDMLIAEEKCVDLSTTGIIAKNGTSIDMQEERGFGIVDATMTLRNSRVLHVPMVAIESGSIENGDFLLADPTDVDVVDSVRAGTMTERGFTVLPVPLPHNVVVPKMFDVHHVDIATIRLAAWLYGIPKKQEHHSWASSQLQRASTLSVFQNVPLASRSAGFEQRIPYNNAAYELGIHSYANPNETQQMVIG